MDKLFVSQVKAIVNEKAPLISNLSNVAAVLATIENINWAGFYLVVGNSLYLGPFQGEQAICPLNFLTFLTICVFFSSKALPHTPFPFWIKVHAGSPWNGPKYKELPTTK